MGVPFCGDGFGQFPPTTLGSGIPPLTNKKWRNLMLYGIVYDTRLYECTLLWRRVWTISADNVGFRNLTIKK